MDTTDFSRLKREIEDRYKAAVANAQAERDKDVEALRRVWKMLHGSGQPPVAASANGHAVNRQPSSNTQQETAGKGEVDAAVRLAVSGLEDQTFTWRQVSKAMENSGRAVNRSSLMQVLRRMDKQGELVVIVQGAGRMPSQFRRAEPKDPPA